MKRPLALSIALMLNTSLASAAVVDSVTSGRWSEEAMWTGGKIPGAGDEVRIAAGHEVIYDVESAAVIRSVQVSGALVFSRDRNTELNVAVLRVGGGGGSGVEDVHDHDHTAPEMAHGDKPARFEVGTPDRPIPAGVTARIRLHYLEGLDKEEAPVLTCRPGGRMDFHGAPMARTWLDLGADAAGGDNSVTLSEAVEGWRVGDEVIVTGSERGFDQGDGEYTTEQRKITGIDGATITLDVALAHPHSGAGQFRSEVANLSRNVIVESADPDGVRGHTMHHRHSAGSISYARFAHLGKEGVLGRYPIHFHQCRDSLRGESVVGVAIIDSANRWVTVHNTHYMVVRDCVGFGSVGHGFFLEDGTEVYNVFDRNLGVQAYDGRRLPEQALPFDPNDGAAFWWANGRNTLVRNTACENEHYGFRYDSQKRSNFDSNLNIRTQAGKGEKVDIRTLPIYRFEDNESHTEGLYSFAFAGTEGVGPDQQHPHRIKGTVAWNTHYAFRAQLPTMQVEDTTIHRAVYGIYRPRFDHHVYTKLRISETNSEPFNRGLDDESTQHGPVSVDGLTFAGFSRGGIPLIQLSSFNPSGTAETHIRKLKIEDRRDRDTRALVDMGGGTRTKESEIAGVPVVVHDLLGQGKGARFVSTRSSEAKSGGDKFRQQAPYTGEESALAEVGDVPFPQLLDPVDDQAPATSINWPLAGIAAKLEPDGSLIVRGTTTDDYATRRVVINGVEAEDIDYNFHRWQARIPGGKPGRMLEITADAEDTTGNREQTPHTVKIHIAR